MKTNLYSALPIADVLNAIAFLARKIKKYESRKTPLAADRKYRNPKGKFAKAVKYIDDLNWMLCDKRLYNAPQDAQEKREVFKTYCTYFEIEIFSYCNRKCTFCQNAYIDRHSENIFMPESTFGKIIDELASVNYGGTLCFHRYNEPLADKMIVQRTRVAREKLPNAILGIHSNGDFATKELLQELAQAGMNYICITRYPPQETDWTSETQQKQAITQFAQKLGLNYEYVSNSRLKISGFEDLDVIVRADKIADIATCRAASVRRQKKLAARKIPCTKPHCCLHVNYDGYVNPCCNVRSDVENHKFFNIANLNETSVFDAFSSEKYCLLRYNLKDYGDKKIYPCSVCDEPRIYQ